MLIDKMLIDKTMLVENCSDGKEMSTDRMLLEKVDRKKCKQKINRNFLNRKKNRPKINLRRCIYSSL